MRWVVRLLLLLAFVLALGAGFVAYTLYFERALPSADTNVVVQRGATTAEVARQLESQGVIKSALSFQLMARAKRVQTEIKAGEYRFPPHLTGAEVLERLTSGGAQVAVWVTIPEGFTAREIAQALADRQLGEERALADYFLQTQFTLPNGTLTPNLEGYLFPDTYLMPIATTPAALAKIMTDQFSSVLPPDAADRAGRLGYTIPQIVTLASLIEREAKADDERRLMAGVYYNRLRLGMPLEVDATIEYTFAHHKNVITNADLARDTPYNTYLHVGLPPTPIANPGRPSLQAAFDPQPSSFLFYVYNGNGHHAFSRTLAEHNANVARYIH
jgi:UPF0755 protein